MSPIFHFPQARALDPEVEAWFDGPEMRLLVRPWHEALRALGPDIRELLHDGWPTACAGDAAFAYVAAYAAHAAIGFYFGAALPDPHGLLEGSGKRMRHLKLRWAEPVNAAAISGLMDAAYSDIHARLADEA